MSVSVSMPQLGESVTEGTVTRWLKKEGERVEADEPLLEVSTDKVDTEIPSPVSGILRGITVAEDETVAVGAELAVIDDEGSSSAEADTADAADGPAAAEAPAWPGGQADDGSGQAQDGAPQAPRLPPRLRPRMRRSSLRTSRPAPRSPPRSSRRISSRPVRTGSSRPSPHSSSRRRRIPRPPSRRIPGCPVAVCPAAQQSPPSQQQAPAPQQEAASRPAPSSRLPPRSQRRRTPPQPTGPARMMAARRWPRGPAVLTSRRWSASSPRSTASILPR